MSGGMPFLATIVQASLADVTGLVSRAMRMARETMVASRSQAPGRVVSVECLVTQ